MRGLQNSVAVRTASCCPNEGLCFVLPYKLTTTTDGTVLVEFTTLSLSESPELDTMARRFQEEFMRSRTKRMLLDCTRLKFMASRGLSLMVTLSRLAQQHKGTFAVCGLSPQLAQLFRFAGLDRAITVYNTSQEALAALNSAGSSGEAPQ